MAKTVTTFTPIREAIRQGLNISHMKLNRGFQFVFNHSSGVKMANELVSDGILTPRETKTLHNLLTKVICGMVKSANDQDDSELAHYNALSNQVHVAGPAFTIPQLAHPSETEDNP